MWSTDAVSAGESRLSAGLLSAEARWAEFSAGPPGVELCLPLGRIKRVDSTTSVMIDNTFSC